MAGKAMGWELVRIFLGLVFAGYILEWIIYPLKIYREKWLLTLRAHTTTTYFGSAGTVILTYVFPILFIAVVACVFLHFQQKRTNTYATKGSEKEKKKGNNRLMAFFKRPALVRGPMGVVTTTELVFFAMFLALLIFIFTTMLQVNFSTITKEKAMEEGEKVWELKLESAGLRLGLLGNIAFCFLFIPVGRGSSILGLVGLTSESCIKYHVWMGHIVMVLFTAHGVCYAVYWGVVGHLSEMLKWDKIGESNVAGELALLAGLGLWATTFPSIRRKSFELFYYTHHLYIGFLFFFLLHVGFSFFQYALPGIYLFLVDRYLRFLQSKTKVRVVSARLLPGESTELTFSKNPGFSYGATSILFINVPSISKLQWHPYTVTSSSRLEPEKMSVLIKKEGSWTQKLNQLLSSTPHPERLEVAVEGPYGPTTNHFLSYDSLVLISGGSGIAPYISIIRELLSLAADDITTPSIHLICAFRTADDLTMLDCLLPVSGLNASDLSRLNLRIDAYVTRQNQHDAPSGQKHTRTIWFKPAVSDQPVSAILGKNSWLWLAVVISSSFVGYLVLFGLVYRYHIYPIDLNTRKIYSYPVMALLGLLFICVSIAGAAGAAVVWNRKQSSMETKQVLNVDAPTPTISPGSWFYNADRELESLPSESLAGTTKVKFGTRPDLKKMLLQYGDGPDVGVYVSGPSAMRREVAAICASGLATNLHYESLSFSW